MTFGRIMMILDCVVRSSWKILRNDGPFISKLTVCIFQYSFFGVCLWRFINLGIEMIIPTSTALLPNEPR